MGHHIMVKCKYDECNNLLRKSDGKKRSGFCHLHYDITNRRERFINYNKTVKKVIAGMNLKELGMRTENVPHIISICHQCNKVYLATPASIKKTTFHFCSPECKGVFAAQHTPNKDTSIERTIELAIKEREWLYLKQVPLENICIADFFLPEFNAVIFCDGDFWHSTDKSKTRADKQFHILANAGYFVYRFSETDIKKSAHNCLERIDINTKSPSFQ